MVKMLFLFSLLDEQRRIVAYLDSVQARLASLRESQSATGEELLLKELVHAVEKD